MHDPIGPLIHLLSAFDQEDPNLTIDEIRDYLVDATRLLGNASAGMSHLRRKVLKSVNPGVIDLAEEEILDMAATNLFRNDFERKMKERAESVKLLTAVSSARSRPLQDSFFQRAAPLPPESWRPSQQRMMEEGTEAHLQLEVTVQIRDTDSQSIIQCPSSKNHLLSIMLIQRGVTPLEVKKTIMAGRLASFRTNLSCISEDQWIQNTIWGYKIEFLQNHQTPQCRDDIICRADGNERRDRQNMNSKGVITEIPPE